MPQKTINAECKFCTIAGKEYLFKVLALYDSLKKCSKSFHLWICCNDNVVYSTLTNMNLKNVTPFPVSDLEDQELLKIKYTRQANEYSWTIKSSLIRYILNNYDIDSLIYCDGDLYFFSDPKPIFEEWGEASILLTHQRDLDWVHAKYGTYQAGLIGFKKDKNGLASLDWWRQKCIEWCYNDPQPEFERWGDQKYLDKIPELFQNVKVSGNLGVNAAPWNSIYNNGYNIYESGNNVFIEKDKLICFHFACILIFNDSEFDLWTFMNIPMQDVIRNKVYIPYLTAIRKSIEKVKKYYNGSLDIFFSPESINNAKTYFRYIPEYEDNFVDTSKDETDNLIEETETLTGKNHVKYSNYLEEITDVSNVKYTSYEDDIREVNDIEDTDFSDDIKYIDENVDEDMDKNVDEDIDEDVDEDIDENVDEDMDKNVDEDIDENVDEDIDEDIDENVDENVDEDIDENVDEDIDENVDEDIDGNIDEDMDENIYEENSVIDKNYVSKNTHSRYNTKDTHRRSNTKDSYKNSSKGVNNKNVYSKRSSINTKVNNIKRHYNFCSLVSMQYVVKELTLYRSLKRQLNNFHLWICCMDGSSYMALSKMRLENVTVIHFKEIEDNKLLAVKKNRTMTEYCWTLKAPLILHLLKKYNLESVVYCDSDLYFFSHPKTLFDEWEGYSSFMCRQGGNYELEKINGGFQAGLLGFTNDESSLKILNWWRKKCIQWCFDEADVKNERWGDQKYLDKVPHLFSNIKLIDNIGINAAPWNLILNNNYEVTKKNEKVFIENEKLIVYHFGSILIFNEHEYDLWKFESLSFSKNIINYIYTPYIQHLKSTIAYLKSLGYRKCNMVFCKDPCDDSKNYFKL